MAVIRRSTGQMRGQTRTLQKQNVFAMFAQTQRPPCVKGAGAERLRDCKSSEFAGKKKVTLSIPSSDSTVLLFLLSKVAQKKKKQKENSKKKMP